MGTITRRPVSVKGTGGTGSDRLEEVPWKEWSEKVDENELAFLYQDKKASGEASTFFKLISRDQGNSNRPVAGTAGVMAPANPDYFTPAVPPVGTTGLHRPDATPTSAPVSPSRAHDPSYRFRLPVISPVRPLNPITPWNG